MSIDGSASLSTIVTIACVSVSTEFAGLERLTRNVWSGSSLLSSVIGTLKDLLVWPAGKGRSTLDGRCSHRESAVPFAVE